MGIWGDIFGFSDEADKAKLDEERRKELEKAERNRLLRNIFQIVDPMANPEGTSVDLAARAHQQQLAEAKLAAEEERAAADQLIQQTQHDREVKQWGVDDKNAAIAELERKTLMQNMTDQARARGIEHPGLDPQEMINRGSVEMPDIMSQGMLGPDGMPLNKDAPPMQSMEKGIDGLRGMSPQFLADLLEEEQSKAAKIFTQDQNLRGHKNELQATDDMNQKIIQRELANMLDPTLDPISQGRLGGMTAGQADTRGVRVEEEGWLEGQPGLEGVPHRFASQTKSREILGDSQVDVAKRKLDMKTIAAELKLSKEEDAQVKNTYNFMLADTGSEEQAEKAVLGVLAGLRPGEVFNYTRHGELRSPTTGRSNSRSGSSRPDGLTPTQVQSRVNSMRSSKDEVDIQLPNVSDKAWGALSPEIAAAARAEGHLVETVDPRQGYVSTWTAKDISPTQFEDQYIAAFMGGDAQAEPEADPIVEALREIQSSNSAASPGLTAAAIPAKASAMSPAVEQKPVVLATEEVRAKQRGIRNWIKTLPGMTDEDIVKKAKSEGSDEATLKLLRQVLGEK